VLSDVGDDAVRQFGPVFTLPESSHDFYRSERVNLPGTQGNERFELPLTGTCVVDRSGVVQHAHVDIDFTKCQEPEEVVGILERMARSCPPPTPIIAPSLAAEPAVAGLCRDIPAKASNCGQHCIEAKIDYGLLA
jgi:hypothetical protein